MYLFGECLKLFREPLGVSMTTSMLGVVAEAELSPADFFLVFIPQAFDYGCRWKTAQARFGRSAFDLQTS
jgi:hypothetical protein